MSAIPAAGGGSGSATASAMDAGFRPRPVAGVEVADAPADQGGGYIIYRRQSGTYLHVDAGNQFLWSQMNGERTLVDLAIAYSTAFGQFPFERLTALIAELRTSGLIEADSLAPAEASRVEGRLIAGIRKFSRTAIQREFNIKYSDVFFAALYQRGGRLLFTRVGLTLLGLIAALGLAAFLYQEPSPTRDLLDVNGSYGVGLLVLMFSSPIVFFIHESAHALSCSALGGRVRRAGMLFYMGSIAFFVDTTDIWLRGRTARILVSLAGPLSNVLVGGVISIIVLTAPESYLDEALYQVAYVAYIGAIFNLNPLLELDGYYALMDAVKLPGLRKRSFAFVREQLWSAIRAGRRLTRDERIFTGYGLLAGLYTVSTIGLAAYIWQNEAGRMFEKVVSGRDLLTTVVVGGLMFMAGTSLVFGLGARAIVLVDDTAQKLRRSAARV